MNWSARHPVWCAAALFVVLSLASTYPIARAPSSYAYFDHPDAQLNMWIMAWDAHALRSNPRTLFDANIFYPAPRTLAYSETLLGYLPIFGPILWLHGSPILAFNAVLLFSFIASGFAMYLLTRHLTGRQWPAIAAGVVYAFAPYRFVHVPQIQLEAMELFPLTFLSLHLFVEHRTWKWAAAIGACLVLQTLCCVYYAVLMAMGLFVFGVLLAVLDARLRRPSAVARLAATAVFAAVLVAPIAGEYGRVHERARLERPIVEIAEKSADASTYLASAAPLHLALGAGRLRGAHDYLFPGVLALLLASAGVISWRRAPIFGAYAAVGLFGVALSFGPKGFLGIPVYTALHDTIWFLHGLRQVSRFGVLALFASAVLAAGGCALIEARLPRRLAVPAMATIATLLFLETFSAPLEVDRPGGKALVRVPPVPAVYSWLARQPAAFAVVELPIPHVGQVWRNAPYVFWSTVHWHPLVNGYSGFPSPDYPGLQWIVARFPDDLSRRALELRGVRYVVIHWSAYTEADRPVDLDRLHRTEWLRLRAHFPDADVYELDSAYRNAGL